MNQESEQDFLPQQIPSANSHEYGGGSHSALPLLNAAGFTVLQLPQPTTTSTSTSTSSAIPDPAIKPPLRKCSSCGFGSAKKRSPPPSFLSSLYQPSSKRPAISSTSSPDPTPPSSSERERQKSPLPLRRSLSDFPCSPVGAGASYYQDFPNPAAADALLKNPLPPSQSMHGNSKNPLPHSDSQDSFPMTTTVPLHRSPSNPSSSSEYYETPAVNTTPPRPRPPPFVRPQMFDHHHGSPNSKKLRRELKGKVEELMQALCEQQQDDDDDDDDDEDDVNINCINKQEKGEMMNQNQNEGCHDGSVWVKQTEGGLILHFNCSCGEGYEVFLNGEKCYYRLA